MIEEEPRVTFSYRLSRTDSFLPWDCGYTDEEFVEFRNEMLGEIARWCDSDGRHEVDLAAMWTVYNFIHHARIGWMLRHEPTDDEEDFGREISSCVDIAFDAFGSLFENGDLEWVFEGARVYIRIINYAAASAFIIDGFASYILEKTADLAALNDMPYRQYLDSEVWKSRRARHLEFAGRRCQVCNRSGQLNVHHRTYERRGYERVADLIVLCADCHRLFHQGGRIR